MLNLKEEIFFTKRVFKDGFGFRGFIHYFKNKFGNSVFGLPKYNCRILPNRNFETHILCQKKDVQMLGWALSSFLYHSGLCPRIFIHDDGSIDKKTADIIEKRFPNLKVIPRQEADRAIYNWPGLSEKILKYRKNGHNLILKLIDIFLLSGGGRVMVMDSDILFFKKPKEIIDFAEGKSSFDSLISPQHGSFDLMVKEHYLRKFDLINKKAGFTNSGLILFDKKSLSLHNMLEYFENTTREPSDYLVEMSGWCCLIAQTKFGVLPISGYHIKGRPNSNTIMKHFTNPRRHELYIYGIDMVKRTIYGS